MLGTDQSRGELFAASGTGMLEVGWVRGLFMLLGMRILYICSRASRKLPL